MVEYTADNLLELCDGQWHTIKATKDRNVVELQVDGGATLQGGGKGSQKDANIYDPLYVGGLPGQDYLTIRPVARIRPVALSGYGSIAHEAKPNGLLTRGP